MDTIALKRIKVSVVKREELKRKLKRNRSSFKNGSGDEYWESVARVVEDHFGIRYV